MDDFEKQLSPGLLFEEAADSAHQRYMFCNRLREDISEIRHRLHWALRFAKTDDLTNYDWAWNHCQSNGVRLFEIVLHEFHVLGLLASLPSLRAVSRKVALVASSLRSTVYSCGVAQAWKHVSQLGSELRDAAWEDPHADFGPYLPSETHIRRLCMSCEVHRLGTYVPGREDTLKHIPSLITAVQGVITAVQGARDVNFKCHPDVFAARVELAQLLLVDGMAEESAEVAQAALSDAELCGTTGQLPGTELQRAQLSKEFEVLRNFLKKPIKRYREQMEPFEEGPAAVTIETHGRDEEGIEDVLGDVDDRQGEEPAIILPEEASWTQDEMYASFIEQRALAPRSSSSAGWCPAFDPVSRIAVLLTFSRASKALQTALIESRVAEVARSQGVDVTPSWSQGAKVFVCGVGPEHLEPAFPDLMPRHVVLYEDDVDDLLEEMKERLPYSLRKVKPHERMSMPADILSLMEVSCGGGSAEDGGAASSTGLESCVAEANDDMRFQVVVLNTFFDLDVYEAEQQSVRSVGSAPF